MSGDTEHPTDNQSESEGRNRQETRQKGVKTKAEVRKVILRETIAAQLLALIGLISLISGHKLVSLGCAFILFYFVLTSVIAHRRLLHYLATKADATKKSIIVFLCGFVPMGVICLFARNDLMPKKWVATEVSKPHFHLAFFTSNPEGGTSVMLHLTNEVLSGSPGQPMFMNGKAGVLSIPVAKGISETVLRFDVVNDSQTHGEYNRVAWRWVSQMHISATGGWIGLYRAGGYTDALGSTNEVSLRPGDGEAIPELTITGVSTNSLNFVQASISGTNSDNYYIFYIRFVVDSNLSAYVSSVNVKVVGTNVGVQSDIKRDSN